MDNQFFIEISKFGIFVGAIWGLIQFWSANEFKKTQYLSELWRKFYTTDKFVQIFDLLDRDDVENFMKIEAKDLFSYLAFLEEIVIFRRTAFWQIYKLRDKNLVYLFQYHFFNVFTDSSSEARKIFWCKITSDQSTIADSEIKKRFWKLQYDFSKKCALEINKIS